MQVLFKIVIVLVVGVVVLVLAVLSPVLVLLFGIFETINMKRRPIEAATTKKKSFGIADILQTMQTLKAK